MTTSPSLPSPTELAAQDLIMAASGTGLLVIIGAGLSAPSGVATFRRGGRTTPLWQRGPALSVTDWKERPHEVWDFLEGRIAGGGVRVQPLAHRPMARLLARLCTLGGKLTVITQNLDLLLEQAFDEAGLPLGHPQRPKLRHVHGRLGWRCSHCGACGDLGGSSGAPPTRCQACGRGQDRRNAARVHSGIRPDVVLFGEQLPGWFGEIWDAAPTHAACLVAGSSLEVTPVGSLPGLVSASGGAVVVCDEVLPGALQNLAGERCRWLGGDIAASLESLQAAVAGTI